jgi:hypothetical protein
MKHVVLVTLLAGCPVGDVSQPQICKDYLNCEYRLGAAVDDGRYGPMGTCWQTTAEAYEACEIDCQNASAPLRVSPAARDAGCSFFVPAP